MRNRRGTLTAFIALLATGGLVAGIASLATPAAAATTGAGFSSITPFGGYLGNYVAPDGARVYCIDAARDWPSGPTGAGFVTGDLATEWGAPLDQATLLRLNFVLTVYGQTAHPETAAAVNAYLYAFTSGRARTHGAGYAAGLYFIKGNPAVEAAYAQIWAAAESFVASPTQAPTASIAIEMTSPRDGVVRVTASPRGAVGVLSLEGAVVVGSDATSLSVTDGTEFAIRGVPQPGQSAYSIAASAQFRASAPLGPAVTLYLTGAQQRTVRHAAPTQIAFETETSLGPIQLEFAPVLESLVDEPVIAVGDSFVDALTATLVDPEQSWPESDGVPFEVVAVGTLYGPLPTAPTPSEAPPADAPVAGSTQVTLNGPGSYLSDGELRAAAEGYYTWVWRISAADQSDIVRSALSADYLFADHFGLAAETVHATTTPELAATGGPVNGIAGASAALLLLLGLISLARSRITVPLMSANRSPK